jgi:predicted alpha/beta-fold hydrolase
MTPYSAPLWLPGGHLQTIYPVLFARAPYVRYHRTRWDTPDGDFIDLDWVEEQDSAVRIQDQPAGVVSRAGRKLAQPLCARAHARGGTTWVERRRGAFPRLQR